MQNSALQTNNPIVAKSCCSDVDNETLYALKGAREALKIAVETVDSVQKYRLFLMQSTDPIAFVRPWGVVVNAIENHVLQTKNILCIRKKSPCVERISFYVLSRLRASVHFKARRPNRKQLEKEIFNQDYYLKAVQIATRDLVRVFMWCSPFVDAYGIRPLLRNYILAIVSPLQDLVHSTLKNLFTELTDWEILPLLDEDCPDQTPWSANDDNWDLSSMHTYIGQEDLTQRGWRLPEPRHEIWTQADRDDYQCEMLPLHCLRELVKRKNPEKDDVKIKELFGKFMTGEGEINLRSQYFVYETERHRTERRNIEKQLVYVARMAGTKALTLHSDQEEQNPFLIDMERPLFPRASLAPPVSHLPSEFFLNWTITDEGETIQNYHENEILQTGLKQQGVLEQMFFGILYNTREPSVLDQIVSIVGTNLFRQMGRVHGLVSDTPVVTEATWFLDHFRHLYQTSAQLRLLCDNKYDKSYSHLRLLYQTIKQYRDIFKPTLMEQPMEDFHKRLKEHDSRRLDKTRISKHDVALYMKEVSHRLQRMTMSDFRPAYALVSGIVMAEQLKEKILTDTEKLNHILITKMLLDIHPSVVVLKTTKELQQDYIENDNFLRLVSNPFGETANTGPPKNREELEKAVISQVIERAQCRLKLTEYGMSEDDYLYELQIARFEKANHFRSANIMKGGSRTVRDYDKKKSSLNQTANTDDLSQTANVGNLSQTANTGDLSQTANTGDLSQTANTGDLSQTANTGDLSQTANTGDLSQTANIGDLSHTANVGDLSHTANAGDSSQTANTGDLSQAANVGNLRKVTNKLSECGNQRKVSPSYMSSKFNKPFSSKKSVDSLKLESTDTPSDSSEIGERWKGIRKQESRLKTQTRRNSNPNQSCSKDRTKMVAVWKSSTKKRLGVSRRRCKIDDDYVEKVWETNKGKVSREEIKRSLSNLLLGVYYCKVSNLFISRMRSQNKTVQKTYSVREFGFEGAKNKATDARKHFNAIRGIRSTPNLSELE